MMHKYIVISGLPLDKCERLADEMSEKGWGLVSLIAAPKSNLDKRTYYILTFKGEANATQRNRIRDEIKDKYRDYLYQ